MLERPDIALQDDLINVYLQTGLGRAFRNFVGDHIRGVPSDGGERAGLLSLEKQYCGLTVNELRRLKHLRKKTAGSRYWSSTSRSTS